MDRSRKVFFAALGLFTAWVAVLGYLVATSSEKPQAKMTTGGDLKRSCSRHAAATTLS